MKLEIGFTNTNKQGIEYSVIGRSGKGNYTVKFTDGTVRENIPKQRILEGNVRLKQALPEEVLSVNIGDRFGKLVVIGLENPVKPTTLCDCGNLFNPQRSGLYHGRNTSCGCVPSNKSSEKFWGRFNEVIQNWEGATDNPEVMKLPIMEFRFGSTEIIGICGETLVDKEFYEYWVNYPFIVDDNKYPSLCANKYVYAKIKGSTQNRSERKPYRLHHLVFGCTNFSNYVIDHIDGNPLNNVRSNLRLATVQQNATNAAKTKSNTISKYKGVFYIKNTPETKRVSKKPWRSTVWVGNKQYTKYSETEKDAALAYNELALKHHGEFARLNIVDEGD
jgi:hypothetical protein